MDQEIGEAKQTEANCNKRLKEVEYKIKHAKELKEKELKVRFLINRLDPNSEHPKKFRKSDVFGHALEW